MAFRDLACYGHAPSLAMSETRQGQGHFRAGAGFGLNALKPAENLNALLASVGFGILKTPSGQESEIRIPNSEI